MFIEKGHKMLWHEMCLPTSPFGFNMRFSYFYMWIFFIRGCFKLHDMDFDELSLLFLLTNVVLRFCYGISKNYQIDITQCYGDWHIPTIDCPIFNVIETYKELACKCPSTWLVNKLGSHPLFLCCKVKWRPSDEVWFMTNLINHNKFHFIVDKLTIDFPNLHKKILSNKMGQSVGNTWMEEVVVLRKYGMEVIGHKDFISYGK
jgi:hypothetical protein